MATEATTRPTTTIRHHCGHSWTWTIYADPRERREGERRLFRSNCPDCSPQAWHHDTRYEVRPVAPVAPKPAPTPVATPAAPAATTRRGDPLATPRQLAYLEALGVAIPAGRALTLAEASMAIDEVKRPGGSIGWLGLEYRDGGN